MDARNYQVTIKGLFFDSSNRVLLTQESLGWWDLPGGRLEHGESFHEALARECMEEMAIPCRILDTQPYWAWSAKNHDDLWKVVLCFRVQFPHLNFQPSDECVKIEFFDASSLISVKTAPQIHPLTEFMQKHQAEMQAHS